MNQPDEVTREGKSQESKGLFGGFRKLLDTTKEKVSGTAGMVTGKKLQQQLEDFTDTVSTAVIGIHRDQRNVRDSLTQLEVQQTSIKLSLHEVQVEQDAMKKTLAQAQQNQDALKQQLAQVQQAQSDMEETLAQVQTSLARQERQTRSPWWMFWRWRWI